MNKRCRLLLTTKCPNNCPLCCNKQFDLFKDVPIIDRWNYDEFILTGGEPLYPTTEKLCNFLDLLNKIEDTMGRDPLVYLYTSVCNPSSWNNIICNLNGITYTVHTQNNAKELIQLLHVLNDKESGYDQVFPNLSCISTKSLWLNLFPEGTKFIEAELAKSPYKWDDITKIFKIRQMEWKENCPIPEGEDFRRLSNPW